MEYLIQDDQHAFFARFIPLFILFFLVLHSFNIRAKIHAESHFAHYATPKTVIDYTPLNERVLWLQHGARGTDICFRRLGLTRQWFETPDIVSIPARLLSKEEKRLLPVDPASFCFIAKDAGEKDQIILCQDPTGKLVYFDGRKYKLQSLRWGTRHPRLKRMESKKSAPRP